MARELYERCPTCGGAGRADPERLEGWRHRPVSKSDGKVRCWVCGGGRFLKIGLTREEVEAAFPALRIPRPISFDVARIGHQSKGPNFE